MNSTLPSLETKNIIYETELCDRVLFFLFQSILCSSSCCCCWHDCFKSRTGIWSWGFILRVICTFLVYSYDGMNKVRKISEVITLVIFYFFYWISMDFSNYCKSQVWFNLNMCMSLCIFLLPDIIDPTKNSLEVRFENNDSLKQRMWIIKNK